MAQAYASTTFFDARVPALATLPEADKQNALDDAESFISVPTFGLKADLAHAYLAGHFLALTFPDTGGGEQGQPSQLKAGEISASFATASVSEEALGTTEWGRRYLAICRTVLPRYVVG